MTLGLPLSILSPHSFWKSSTSLNEDFIPPHPLIVTYLPSFFISKAQCAVFQTRLGTNFSSRPQFYILYAAMWKSPCPFSEERMYVISRDRDLRHIIPLVAFPHPNCLFLQNLEQSFSSPVFYAWTGSHTPWHYEPLQLDCMNDVQLARHYCH